MPDDDWEKQSWSELTGEADQGVRGQGALVEAIRRFEASSTKLAAANNRLFCVSIVLSIVMACLAIIQIILIVRGD